MVGKFDVVSIESLSVDKIIEVLDLALGHGNEAYKKTEALWKWKHLESPFGPSYGTAALDPSNKQVAGIRLLMYWGFENISDEKIICARAVDVSTHPDYRRMGIFSTLTQKAISDLKKQGVTIIFATPKLKGKSIGGHLKLGFEKIDSWPVYIKILHPISFLMGITIGRKKNKRQFLPKWSDVFSKRVLTFHELSKSFTTQVLNDFFEKADQNRKKVSGWRIIKDYNYVHWRYGLHPNVDYGFIPLVEDGKVTGLGILRRNIRYNMREVIISELLLINSNIVSGRKLLREINTNITADYIIAHYNCHTPEMSVLKRSGFIKASGQEIVFLIKELTEGKDNFKEHQNWNLSLGDIELF